MFSVLRRLVHEYAQKILVLYISVFEKLDLNVNKRTHMLHGLKYYAILVLILECDLSTESKQMITANDLDNLSTRF